MKKILSLALVIVFFIVVMPLAANANVLHLDCYSQSNCGFCDALELATRIAKFVLMLAGSLSLLLFIIAGVILITSQGVSGRIMMGRKIIWGSLLGILIVYFAWVGVNFVLYSFSGQQTDEGVAVIFSKPWNEIECVKMAEPVPTIQPSVRQPSVSAACKSIWESGSEPSCGGSCVGFQTGGINLQQCFDSSPDLVNFLTCMDNELTNNPTRYGSLQKSDIIITSISDDMGLKRCRDNYAQPPCAHSRTSCHYGRGSTDGSHAVDIRRRSLTSTQITLLEILIRNCNGAFLLEGDHVHASSPNCGGR